VRLHVARAAADDYRDLALDTEQIVPPSPATDETGLRKYEGTSGTRPAPAALLA
jgi:hypothetical protein